MSIYTISSFSASLLSLLLANFVFYKNSKNQANRLFALFCFLMSIWGFNEGMYRSASSYEEAYLWTRMNFSCWLCCATLVHFTLIFTESSKYVIRRVMSAYYLCSIVGAYYEVMIAIPQKEDWGYTYAIHPDPFISNTQFIYFMSINTLPLILFGRYWLRQRKGSRKRQQVRMILVAIGVPVVIGMIELILTFVVNERLPEFTVFSMAWLAAIIGYASWRYELFQISPEKAADQIIELMADALIIMSPRGKMLTINRSVEGVLGYRSDELVGQHISMLFNDTKVLNREIIPELRKVNHLSQREVELVNRSGDVLTVEYSISQFLRKNESIGMILTFHDITQRKRDELQIYALNHQLSEKNLEMEQMIYMVTHDLRSPLTNIAGISELMKLSVEDLKTEFRNESHSITQLKSATEKLISTELEEPLHDLQITAQKMSDLVHSLLEVAHLKEKKLQKESINMRELVDNIFKANGYRIQSLGIKVEVEDLVNCMGDRTLTDQIFSNLIDNAIKYIDPKRPALIRVHSKEEGADVVYCVTDQGIGIPSSHLHSIFRTFSQVDREQPGYGIGLSTILQFVEKLDGKIWVESTEEVGSTFFVRLPKSI